MRDGWGGSQVECSPFIPFRVLSLCLDSVTDVAMSVATYPSIASTPTRPSVAVPAFQAVATPSHGAMLIAPAPSATPTAPELQLFVSDSSCNENSTLMPSTSVQPLDFGSFGPEMDLMLQTETMATFPGQWGVSTTPQWNFSGLGSDPFLSGDMLSANTATNFSSLVPPPDYPAMLAHTGPGLPIFSPVVSPSKSSLPLLPLPPLINDESSNDDFTRRLQLFAYTGPGSMPNHPQQPIVQNSEAPEGPLLGKRKPVPSLRAQRDNKIGSLSKENNEPVPARGKKGKGKGKRPVPDVDESRPGKKTK